MTTSPHLPAGPYQMLVTASIGEHQGSRHVYVIDGSGRKIASIWGKQDEKLAIADLLIGAREASKGGDLTTKIRDAMIAELARQAEEERRGDCMSIQFGTRDAIIDGRFDLDKVAAAVEAVLK